MTIESQVADLTTATTALLNAVNVRKAELVQAVADAESVVSDAFKARLADVKSDFGASGNGVSNDLTAVRAALTASADVRFPAGTFYMSGSGSALLSPQAGAVLSGAGKGRTVLVFAGADSYFNAITMAGALTLRDMTIRLQPPAGSQASAISCSQSGLTCERVAFEGGVTYSGGVSHSAYGLNVSNSGTQDGYRLTDCTFSGFLFPLLKTNAATSSQDDWEFLRCGFSGNYREDLSFNSPLGSMTDMRAVDCQFSGNLGRSAGFDSLACAFASINGFSVRGCKFEGPIRDAIHIEEASKNGVISGNNIAADIGANGGGISLVENNIGGVMICPENIAITGNTITQAGTVKLTNTFGVWLVNNVSVDFPAKEILVSDNIIEGFHRGVLSQVANGSGCVVTNNTAINCTDGFMSLFTVDSFSDNASVRCDAGVVSDNGGMFVRHKFVDCAVSADARTSFPVVLADPEFVFSGTGIAAAETKTFSLVTLDANGRMHAFGSIYANCELDPRYSTRRDELTFDGTTLTNANKFLIQPSSIQSSFVLSGGALKASIYSGGARTDLRVHAWLHGHVVVAV